MYAATRESMRPSHEPMDNKNRRWGLAIGGILLTLLLAAVFTSDRSIYTIRAKSWRAVMVL